MPQARSVQILDFTSGVNAIAGDVGGFLNVSTSPVTLAITDRYILVDATGGARTLNLPAIATSDLHVYVIKIVAGGNTVTIDPNASETVDGATTLAFSGALATRTIACKASGTNLGWWVVRS